MRAANRAFYDAFEARDLDAMSRVWPYLGALLIGTIIVAAFPWLSVGFL